MAAKKNNPHAPQIRAAKDAAAAKLTEYVRNLQVLGDGGYVEEELEFQPAGLILIDEQDDDPLAAALSAVSVNTRYQRRPRKVLAFPDLPPDQLVLVKKKVRTLAPDKTANMYLLDRIIGKPEVTTNVNTGEGAADEAPKNVSVDELRDQWTNTPTA